MTYVCLTCPATWGRPDGGPASHGLCPACEPVAFERPAGSRNDRQEPAPARGRVTTAPRPQGRQ
jgi:hypothetical protein